MTMMTPIPDDTDYEALLTDYAAPLEDDGFSDRLAAQIHAVETRLMRLRFICLAVACTLGGLIAGTQFKALVELLTAYNLQAGSLWGVAALMVFAFVVWATLDNREAGLV